jgi:DNA-binding transcriptional ArsR family regulator
MGLCACVGGQRFVADRREHNQGTSVFNLVVSPERRAFGRPGDGQALNRSIASFSGRRLFDKWLTVQPYWPILSCMVKYIERLDRTFGALVDPTRRAILAQLERKDGASISELAAPFAIKLPAVMKHLNVLDDAGLVTRSKSGRTVTVRLRPQPMREAMDWLRRYEHFWSGSLDRLATYAESKETEARRRGR